MGLRRFKQRLKWFLGALNVVYCGLIESDLVSVEIKMGLKGLNGV